MRINFDFYLESDVPLPRRLRQHVAFDEFLEDASEEAETVYDYDDETDSDFERFECHYRRDHGDAAFEELMNYFGICICQFWFALIVGLR